MYFNFIKLRIKQFKGRYERAISSNSGEIKITIVTVQNQGMALRI